METKDVITLVIATIALIMSISTFYIAKRRAKRESTLKAYSELQEKVFSRLPDKDQISKSKKGDDSWTEITFCLAHLENFSVGVNTGIYSVLILRRLGGRFFIEKYDELSSVINQKEEENGYKVYGEFAKVSKNLQRLNECSLYRACVWIKELIM